MLLPGTSSRKIWKLNSWDVLLRSPSFLFKSCGFLIRRGFKSILQSFITDGISIFFLLMKKIIYFSVFKLSWYIDIKNKKKTTKNTPDVNVQCNGAFATIQYCQCTRGRIWIPYILFQNGKGNKGLAHSPDFYCDSILNTIPWILIKR